MAIPVTGISHTVHGGSCRGKAGFTNKRELIVACKIRTFVATFTDHEAYVTTPTQQLTSFAVANTFFPTAADQLV
jgi:hypothetical protein